MKVDTRRKVSAVAARIAEMMEGGAGEAERGERLRQVERHIRAAIEDDPGNPRRIITVRGSGYVFAKSQDA